MPLALLVMLVMELPSIGGWGPREGATAWAFGAAGLGAQHGVGAVARLELAIQGARVLLDGVRREVQAGGDLAVGGAGRHQLQDLLLARAQARPGRRLAGLGV